MISDYNETLSPYLVDSQRAVFYLDRVRLRWLYGVYQCDAGYGRQNRHVDCQLGPGRQKMNQQFSCGTARYVINHDLNQIVEPIS